MTSSDLSSTSCEFDAPAYLKHLTQQPGVYQMIGNDRKVLYVGKAKNLKKRVSSYFRSQGLPIKTQALVQKICDIEVTITQTETEALILEQNLIKSQRPPYNILLRDDKSYPYIFVSSQDDYPRISLHRGAKRKQGRYFGPYPSVNAVKDSLNFLQKTFRVRQCEDSVFSNRSRPCLQYQIDRCTAPCVDYIDPKRYAEDVQHTEWFLQGKAETLMSDLSQSMERASTDLDFESAAVYRDQITALRRIQSEQVVESSEGEVDVISVAHLSGCYCVHVLFVRGGRIVASRSYYPKEKLAENASELLSAFIPQYYLGQGGREIPRQILLSESLEDTDVVEQALSTEAGRGVHVLHKLRGQRAKWVNLALTAAEQNVQAHLNNKQNMLQRFEQLQDALQLPEVPSRLECFDISHSSGEATVASCVVFDQNGPLKSDYRRFNIEDITGGDDYAAMEQAINRRYTRLQKGEGKLPDILFIDGGKGQLNIAKAVLAELGVNSVELVGVAKGSTRKAGFETLLRASTNTEVVLDSSSPALHLIQHIRDESHRFAITGHKQRRDKKRKTSMLEGIPAVGAKRRKALLMHFGGLQEIAHAGVDELSKAPGISKKIAEDIYSALHNE